MSGFTALAERLASRVNGAEELCDALSSFFAVLLEEVERYGGDCIKFSGDALSIIWAVDNSEATVTGAAAGESDKAGEKGPQTLEEATVHAARCSAAVHERLRGYPQVHGVTLTMHMGLGCGTVTMLYVGGTYSRWEFVLTGDPMNQIGVAEPLAQKGQTVLGPEAFDVLRST